MVKNTKKVLLAENQDKSNFFQSEQGTHLNPIGSSGTEIFAGYFSEEYLQELRGTQAADLWDKMRRSESQVAMILNAVMNPIKSATWSIDGENKDHVELIKHILFKQVDWQTFLHEALSFIPFGFSIFEVIHNVNLAHKKFGDFNGLSSLGFRSQRTIQEWNLERGTGKLLSVYQEVYSDVGENSVIPGQFLIVFTNQKEGDNFEGVSALRPMYGAYKRKDLYLKLAAIGVEKYAVGVPVGTIPSGKSSSQDEVTKFKNVLSSYTSHELAYITKPEGWDIELQKNDFDASKIVELLKFENTEMINSMVANFLALGTTGSGGAFALSNDLSDFFQNGLVQYANLISGTLNRCLIPHLIKLNFGEQESYPELKHSGINDKAGKELSDILKSLADSNYIKPDAKLEEFLRDQYKLPKADESTAREKETNQQNFQPQLSEKTIKLADTYLKDTNKGIEKVKLNMKNALLEVYERMRQDIKSAYNGASAAEKNSVIIGMQAPMRSKYKSLLKDLLAEQALIGINGARKEVPSKKNVKLAEYMDTLKLASTKEIAQPLSNLDQAIAGGFFDKLPPKIKRLVDTQAALVAETQLNDVEKATYFQFASSAASTEDIDQILSDIDSKILPVIEEGSKKTGMSIDVAAANAVTQVVQQARMEWFFEPEVLNEIESFTFTNEDPVSEICKELNGTTWDANDPNVDRYGPPLHHLCKSRIVPNLKGVSSNPEIERGEPSLTQKAINAITLNEK